MKKISIAKMPASIIILDYKHSFMIMDASERFLDEAGLLMDRNCEFNKENSLSFLDLLHHDDVRKFIDLFKDIEKDGIENIDNVVVEARVRDKSREFVWTSIVFSSMDDNTYDNCIMASLHNVDTKKRLEEDLKIQLARFDLIKDVSNEFIFEYDPKNKKYIIPIEMQLRRGISKGDEYEGIDVADFKDMISPNHWNMFKDYIMSNAKIDDVGVIEYELNTSHIGKTAHYKWYRCFYKRILDDSGKLVRAICRNIDIQKDRDKETDLEYQMKLDPMTGVYNKAACEKEVEEFINGHPDGEHAIIMLDIDDFKRINDSFGHLYGDTVIKTVANHIKERFRSSDIIGRVGGDEFLILMKDTTQELAESVAKEICKNIRTIVRTQSGDFVISCSVGISMFPKSGFEYTELFKKAEIAMYVSKKNGKDRVGIYEKGIYVNYENKYESIKLSEALQSDEEFANMCTEMLLKSRNINASLNLILQYIGKRLSAGGVSVFKINAEMDKAIRTHKWTAEQGIFLLPSRSFLNFDNRPLIEKVFNGGRVVIDDMQETKEISEYEKKLLISDNVHACVYCKFEQGQSLKGFVSFQNMDEARVWTDKELDIMESYANLIGVFLALAEIETGNIGEGEENSPVDRLTGMITDETFVKAVNDYRTIHPDEKRLFVVSGDIDGFAYVNENFGTEAGNELLREIGHIFRTEAQNVFICRQFSDFFCGFFAEFEKKRVMKILKKYSDIFIERTRKYFPNSGIRIALGMYEWEDDVPITVAMENASMARKHAKELGSSTIVEYNNDMREQKKRDRIITSTFYKDLENGNILLYMQPKFNLRSKKIIGAESLARWRNEIGDPTPPVRFIDSLERNGYITDLDFYILEETLKHMAEWKDKGYKLIPVSVNFSRRHFTMGGIYERVVALTDKYKIPHDMIEIELTESLFTDRMDRVRQELDLLHIAGFKVDIDDFGTGFSSLGMLMDMAADVVKIDKSFLKFDTGTFEDHKEFMKLLCKMLKISGNRVICEGVETEEHADFLSKCGFVYGQGFLIDPPIPAIIFEQKYMAGNKQ